MISIITPVYNGERFIRACIETVIRENFDEVEHLIIDGGSNDGTIDIVREYASIHPHIRWISEPDKGQSDAMNKGLKMANGLIVGFLNVDDFYEPGVLKKIAGIFNDVVEPAFVVGNCKVWDDNSRLLYTNKPKNILLTDLLLGVDINPHPVNASQYFYHKSLHDKVGYYNIDDEFSMDLDFILKAVQVANIYYFNETWGNYRLIKGTKTYLDIEDQGSRRGKEILKQYRKTLPWPSQLLIIIKRPVFLLIRFVQRIWSFIKSNSLAFLPCITR